MGFYTRALCLVEVKSSINSNQFLRFSDIELVRFSDRVCKLSFENQV